MKAVTAKTAAERQAERKARQLAAGMKVFKRWAHPDDHGALSSAADELERQRIERLAKQQHQTKASP